MCGACGIKLDWAGSLVSGPLRRRDIARCLGELSKGVTVQAISRGWLIKGRTGVATPVQTLDELIDVLAPRALHTTWEQFEQAGLGISAPRRVDNSDSNWPPLAPVPANAREVLSNLNHLPAHMKLALFVFGARICRDALPVFTTIDGVHRLAVDNNEPLATSGSTGTS